MTYAQFELQKIDVITKKEKEFIENAGVSCENRSFNFDLGLKLRPLVDNLKSDLKIIQYYQQFPLKNLT